MRSEPEAAVFKGPREGPRLTIMVQNQVPYFPEKGEL